MLISVLKKVTSSEIFRTLVLAAILFFVVQALLQNYKVFGASMEPSFESGEHILVNRAAYMSIDLGKLSKLIPFYDKEDGDKFYLLGEPDRGDVVIIKSPPPPPDRLIKRIVGLPGDTVEIKGGTVYINNHPLEEPYTTGFSSSLAPVKMPEDHYFVLGDNRGRSNDSRFPGFGPVHRSNILGKAWLAYWPFSSFGLVDSHSLDVPSNDQ